MHAYFRSGARWLSRLSPGFVFFIGLIYLLALGALDCFSSPHLSFTLFYLLGILFVGWGAGLRPALLLALVATVVVGVHEAVTITGAAFPWAVPWNTITMGLVFAGAAGLTAAGTLRDREERFRLGLEAARMVTWDYDIARGTLRYSDNIAEFVGGSSIDPYCSLAGVLMEIHAEDRDNVRRALKEAEKPGAMFEQEYRAQMLDGTTRWIFAKGRAVRDKAGVATRILGVSMDITERRRLEQQILEVNDRVHAHIGQELHDGICQDLVSLAFDANDLERQLLEHERPEAPVARRIADLLDRIITETRQLSRGLFPIRLEIAGLSPALEELTVSLQERFKVECAFEAPESVVVADRTVATHLYRIAQEALVNALKHSRAKHIRLELRHQQGLLELSVADDGTGMTPAAADKRAGMGLHIMDYRARAIGGVLHVGPGPQGGTVVTCSLPDHATAAEGASKNASVGLFPRAIR